MSFSPATVQFVISPASPPLCEHRPHNAPRGPVLSWDSWPKPRAVGTYMGTMPGILPSTPLPHEPQAAQLPERWGRSCPFSLPCPWAQLLLAVPLPAGLPAWLSLSPGVMHSVLTCLAFTHHRVKLYSQPHLSGSNQKQAHKGRDGTLQNEKHLYF